MPTPLAEKADLLLRLHQGPAILVLPNAWDAASARVFERAGFPAVATTSAGVAFALGYPDGERTPRQEMLDAVARIARSVAVPVTADMEAGYGQEIADAEATARGVIAAGAVGLNFEDAHGRALVDPAHQAERIRALRRVGAAEGVHLVINARTDVYLLEAGAPETRFDETVRRANVYREAGADCIFVPGARDPETIGRLVRAIHAPLNVIALPGVPPPDELQRLGVARLSTGSGPMRAALTVAQRTAEALIERGDYSPFTRDILAHAEVNGLMS